MRVKFQFQLTGQVEFLKQFVLTDIGADHLLDLTTFQQDAEAKAINAAIVGYDRQVSNPGQPHGRDKIFRNAAEAKAPGHHCHPVKQQARERCVSIGVNFLNHDRFLSDCPLVFRP